jgi:hypothetical protein
MRKKKDGSKKIEIKTQQKREREKERKKGSREKKGR